MVWNVREARHRRGPGNRIMSGSYNQMIKVCNLQSRAERRKWSFGDTRTRFSASPRFPTARESHREAGAISRISRKRMEAFWEPYLVSFSILVLKGF